MDDDYFTEEDIYVVTKYRLSYRRSSENCRENAVNAALAHECVDTRPIITGCYSIFRGATFLGKRTDGA